MKTWAEAENIFKDNPRYDMSLSMMDIDEYRYRFSRAHWVEEENQLVILSAHYTETQNIAKIFELFSLSIWLHILISTIILSLFITVSKFLGIYLSCLIILLDNVQHYFHR